VNNKLFIMCYNSPSTTQRSGKVARKIVEQWREERAKLLADYEESGRRTAKARYADLVALGEMGLSYVNYCKRLRTAMDDRKVAQNASKTKV